MSAFLGKAGKSLFEKNLEQYSPQDPLYEFYVNDHGKKKRRKRDVPPGLSARDAKILKSVQRRAHYLDKGFHIFGFRFGWSFVIGLVPVLGDVADLSLNYLLVVRKARQANIPRWLLRRLLLNVAVSASVGLIPGVGDICLAVYKANSRNAVLLEEFLRIRGEESLKMQEQERASQALHDGTLEGNRWKKGVGKDAELVKGEVASTMPPEGNQKNETPGKASAKGRTVFSFLGRGKTGADPGWKDPPLGDERSFVVDIAPTKASSS